jgi:hypothetical protein
MNASSFIHLLVGFVVAPAACAQEFSIPWFTLNGSGGSSSGGAFSLSSTIAPVASEPLSGGGFTVAGGVWSLAATVVSPDTPLLRVQLTAGGILLAWPHPSDGFQLEESPSLTAPVWSNVAALPSVVGAEKQVILPAPPGHRFFRLHKP